MNRTLLALIFCMACGHSRVCDGPSGACLAGELGPSIDGGAAGTQLPSQTKGYELYAWDEGGAVRFTLITGTNRPKTDDEISGASADVVDGEWVLVRGRGLERLEQVLRSVPRETSVVLLQPDALTPLSAEDRARVESLVASTR